MVAGRRQQGADVLVTFRTSVACTVTNRNGDGDEQCLKQTQRRQVQFQFILRFRASLSWDIDFSLVSSRMLSYPENAISESWRILR